MSEKSADRDESAEDAAATVDSGDAELTDSSSEVELTKSVDEGEKADDVQPVTAGRATAGSARAAARRSGVRAGVTERKGAPTRSREAAQTEKVGLFGFLGRYVREVVAELRKVIWPARNQMVTYTLVVILFVSFMVALVAGLDVLFAEGVLAVFG